MNKNTVDQAYQLLESHTAHQPREQIIRQVGIVLERLKFIPDPEALLANNDHLQIKSSLNFLFQQDLSQSIQLWLDELVNRRLTEVLVGQSATDFYQQVQSRLHDLHEIRVITAVQINQQLQDSLASQLLVHHQQSRVVFEVMPSIMGGCLIIDEQERSHDYSLKSNLGHYTKEFMQRKLQEIKA